MKASAFLAVAILCTMTGCGLSPNGAIAPQSVGTQKAADESDHAQMNAIVKGVLDGQFKAVVATSDANRDGALSQAEYAKGHDAELTTLFMTQFDGNKDGKVTAAEYKAALKGTTAVEAYHHLTEARMEQSVTKVAGQGDFGFSQMRTYLTQELGSSGDFLLISKLMGRVDLNGDGKVFSDPKEGPAFMILFAQAQLEHALGLPLSPINA